MSLRAFIRNVLWVIGVHVRDCLPQRAALRVSTQTIPSRQVAAHAKLVMSVQMATDQCHVLPATSANMDKQTAQPVI